MPSSATRGRFGPAQAQGGPHQLCGGRDAAARRLAVRSDKESPSAAWASCRWAAGGAARGRAVVPSSASEKAGLLVGDRIKGVDGQAAPNGPSLSERVQQSPEQPLRGDGGAGGQRSDLTLTPDVKKVRGQLVGFVGLSPQLVPLPDEYRTLLQYGPLQALWHGVQETPSLIT